MRTFALAFVLAAAGCASLIGLDDVDRVPCVGESCVSPNDVDGSSGGSSGNGGSSGGTSGTSTSGGTIVDEDVSAPLPIEAGTPDGDATACTPWQCPSPVNLCDKFESATPTAGDWSGATGSPALDTTTPAPCGASTLKTAGPSWKSVVVSTTFTSQFKVRPQLATWDKSGKAILASIRYQTACGSPLTELFIDLQSDGVYLEACPSCCGCSSCGKQKLAALPAVDDWFSVTWSGSLGGGSPTTTASFGGLGAKTVSYGNGGSPFSIQYRLGTDVRDTASPFTANYDDFGIDW